MRVASIAVILAVSAGACGGGAEERLSEASGTLGEIRSGILDVGLSIAAVSAPGSLVGFEIHGPFAVEADGLEADLRYRQTAGSAEAQARFVAADGRAFVESGGSFYELPLAEDASAARAPGVLQELGFEGWATDPRILDRGSSDQVTIVAALDEVAALDGIGRLLDELEMKEASGFALLEGLDPGALERSIRGGVLVVRVGKDDGLFRGLTVRLRLRIDPSSPLADVLEDVAGARLLFHVEIGNPNEPIHVIPPRDALPIGELPTSS